MYLREILYLLSWPVLIFACYHIVRYYLKKLEIKLAEDGEEVGE